jgi:hypothetical protein
MRWREATMSLQRRPRRAKRRTRRKQLCCGTECDRWRISISRARRADTLLQQAPPAAEQVGNDAGDP